jgi:DNA polymerase-1
MLAVIELLLGQRPVTCALKLSTGSCDVNHAGAPFVSEGPVVHLLDGHVYIFRAYHSMPPLEAPDGTPTGAVRGYASTLVKYLAEQQATHAAVCFDYALESFRNEILPGYKSSRGKPPEDLEPQFDLCAELTRALGVAVYEQERYEADDLLATLATQLAERVEQVVIVTSDKDLTQLVREDGRIVLHDLARGVTLDANGVREKFGVSPDQIPDYLGLVGDAVDDLPGVPGVGPRTAAAALGAFGSIDHIPADPRAWADVAVRGAARAAAAIEAHRAQALRVRELATVEREVPGLRVRLPDLAWGGALRTETQAFFERLGWGAGIRERIPRWREVG